MIWNTITDMYIFVYKYISELLPVVQNYVGNYIHFLKPTKIKTICFQNNHYVFLHDKVNNKDYVKILTYISKDDTQIIPLKTRPCIYLQVAYDKHCINIYDNVKKYFVDGNTITRELIEYIVYDEHQVDLSKHEDYKIHVFTNDSTFDIFGKTDKFVL